MPTNRDIIILQAKIMISMSLFLFELALIAANTEMLIGTFQYDVGIDCKITGITTYSRHAGILGVMIVILELFVKPYNPILVMAILQLVKTCRLILTILGMVTLFSTYDKWTSNPEHKDDDNYCISSAFIYPSIVILLEWIIAALCILAKLIE